MHFFLQTDRVTLIQDNLFSIQYIPLKFVFSLFLHRLTHISYFSDRNTLEIETTEKFIKLKIYPNKNSIIKFQFTPLTYGPSAVFLNIFLDNFHIQNIAVGTDNFTMKFVTRKSLFREIIMDFSYAKVECTFSFFIQLIHSLIICL